MPKVTSVEPQKKTLRLRSSAELSRMSSGRSPHRFNIFLDGEFAFGADEDLVVEYRLVSGKILTTQEVEKILSEVEAGKLMERMYRLFNIRGRSEKEIRDYLKNLSFKRKIKGKEGLSGIAIEFTVDKLKKKGLLNDLEFAKEWVEARRKSKQKGLKSIKSELYQKGIDKEIIEEAVNGQSSIISEEQLAAKALEKKMKIWSALPYLEKKKKAFEYLARKGFEYEVIKEVVNAVIEK